MTPRSANPTAEAALRTRLLCPLCRARGRAVFLEAQLERDEELLVVTELAGCRHADGFGDPVLLTFEEEWLLIEAALAALECPTRRRTGV
jgi:hypothetical protein